MREANVRRKLKDNAQSFDLVTDKPGNLYIYVYTLLHVCVYIEREREIGGEGEIFRWIYIDFIKIDEDFTKQIQKESFLDKEAISPSELTENSLLTAEVAPLKLDGADSLHVLKNLRDHKFIIRVLKVQDHSLQIWRFPFGHGGTPSSHAFDHPIGTIGHPLWEHQHINGGSSWVSIHRFFQVAVKKNGEIGR